MYQPEAYLTDHLAVSAQMWADEFRSAHGLDDKEPPEDMAADEWEALKSLDAIAKWLVDATHALDGSAGDPRGLLEEMTRLGIDVREHGFFAQAMEVHLMGELEDELHRLRHRSVDLVRHIVSVRTERARAFLSRLGACYLRGMQTESVIMCGAVLDAALQEAVQDEQVRELVRCGKHVSLGNRVDFMRKSGRWSEDLAATAFGVADARNNAVHTAPELERDVDQVIRELATCLNALEE